MTAFDDRLAATLAERRVSGLYRQRLTLDSAQGSRVRIDGCELLNFASNDYLGLAAHPQVIEALRDAARRWGVGSGASHLVCGHSAPHRDLEEALAGFTGRSRALLFGSGYAANTALLESLLGPGDSVLQDRLNHASLLDGALHSGARLRRFAHNDMADLDRKLALSSGPALVAVDAVFSMDGDTAPLPELALRTQASGAWLMVDDAHGFGLQGPGGAGTVAEAGLNEEQVPVLMATLGKALGTGGAFIAGSEALIEFLLQRARHYIYSTATPPAVAAATLKALELLHSEAWRREHLQVLISRFRAGATALELPLAPVEGPIQPLLVGDDHALLRIGEALRERGLLVGAIRPPTVPAGTARLRVTLSAAHSEAQVDRLLEGLEAVWFQR